MAEELRLEQLFGEAGAVQIDERSAGARRAVVDQVRVDALARARLPLDQYRRRHARDLREELVEALHGGGDAGEAVDVGAVRAAQRLQLAARGDHPLHAGQRQRERVVVERLLQERLRAEAHRLDHAVERPLARHHDHRHGLGVHLEVVQQLQAGDVGEVDVEQRHVGRERGEGGARVTPVHRRAHLPLAFEKRLEPGDDRGIVVDDQESIAHVRKSYRCAMAGHNGNPRCSLSN